MLLIPETIESKYYTYEKKDTYEKREPLYGLNNVLRPDNIKMNYDNNFWNKYQKPERESERKIDLTQTQSELRPPEPSRTGWRKETGAEEPGHWLQ